MGQVRMYQFYLIHRYNRQPMGMFVDMLIFHVHSHEMFHKTKQAAILTTYMLLMNIVWTQLEFQDIQEHQSVQYIVVNVTVAPSHTVVLHCQDTQTMEPRTSKFHKN